MFDKCNIIHEYSRKQAIKDGVLIDVTVAAKEIGFKMPIALTAAVWAEYVGVPNGVIGQDERGRLWDILWVLYVVTRGKCNAEAEVRYHVHVRNDNLVGEPPLVELKAICGPGDDGKLCLTVMKQEED